MTDYYVYSGATGLGDGTSWANAYTTLSAALASKAASDRLFVAHDHAETQATSMTLTAPAAWGLQILCVNRAGSVPPVSADLTTGATVTTTIGSDIIYVGQAYVHGITFSAATSGNQTHRFTSSSYWRWLLNRCTLKIGSPNNNRIAIGSASGNNSGGDFTANNCQFYFTVTGQGFSVTAASATIRGSVLGSILAAGSAVPSILFSSGQPGNHRIDVVGVDLSQIAGTLLAAPPAGQGHGISAKFRNCKLNAGVTALTGTILGDGQTTVDIENCDSADTTYRMEYYRFQGDTRQETTIVRTGGASDGTTPLSWKMTSNANADFRNPLDGPRIFFRYDGPLGSPVTATVEVVNDGATLNDDDIWGEVEYLGTSGVPLGALASDAKADVLATGAGQTTSAATWTTTGLASPVAQKLGVTFTPQEAGVYSFSPKLGKASATVYADPLVTVA